MTRREPHLRLRHMLDHAREAAELARERTREDLDQDRQFELALVRLLEIVGEAASRVPEEERRPLSELPWREIVDFRNQLIHGYDAVDLDIVWKIVETDLQPLIDALERAIDPET